MPGDLTQKIDQEFSAYPRRTYKKGQILIFANEDPEYIYYLKDGMVRVYTLTYRGEEVVLNTYKPGAFFPMAWAINRVPNRFFYETETPTTLHVVPVDVALAYVKTNADVMYDLMSRVYRGLEGILDKLAQSMSGSAKSRLMHEILVDAKRFGDATQSEITIHTKEVDFAARTGLSRETVSRNLHALQKEGLVRLQSRTIVLSDLTAFAQKLSQLS